MKHNFENLEVYKRSLAVSVKIMKVIDDVRPFRLAEQIVSSSISIPSNIAEGAERPSDKDFVKFLGYSSGSAAELITQLQIIHLSGKIIDLDLPVLILELKEINAMLRKLIQKLSNNTTNP
jgi:four helix bundle protein